LTFNAGKMHKIIIEMREDMNVTETAAAAAIELSNTMKKIDTNQVNGLIEAISSSDKVFVYGAGRSMLMLRCLAMRLMHLGFESYVVGDTTTPAYGPKDLLILGSGSGETSSLINIAGKAKKIGGKIAVLTIKADSTLGKMGDYLVEIPAYTDKVSYADMEHPILPGGSLFEQSMLVLGDAMVLPLSERAGVPTDHAFNRHANLE
jgi:6-phospho 3-hexuloisomerase